MTPIGWSLAALAGLVAWVVALLVLRFAERLGLVQLPDTRSSHTIPTPSGGGLGIVAGGTFAALPLLISLPGFSLPVLAAALLLALVGFQDDRTPLQARYRLVAQALATGLVLLVMPLDLLVAAFGLPVPAPVLFVLLVLAGTLWINLFNFMDGIDGLAATEAIFILVAATVLILFQQPGLSDHPLIGWMIGLAAACLGFLALNWPPARLFMGDVGSTYLALMIGFFALATRGGDWLTIWQWLILVAAFATDSTITLLRRALRGERIWVAHRRHAYQALARRFGSHRNATLLYLLVNLVLLLPLAALAGLYRDWGWLCAVAAYAILVPAVLGAGAGARATSTG